MMRVDHRKSLYMYANRNNIDVDWFPMKKDEAFSLPVDGTCAIAIDPRRITCIEDESVKLAHELGHCMYGGFYDDKTPLDIKEQHEYRANAWAVRKVIPWSLLRKTVRSGIAEIWDLADFFGVTEPFMRWAIDYYTNRSELSF